MKIPTLLITLLLPLSAIAKLPDIILMMSDDQGWEETGYNDHPHVKTPVLDEMAANGLKDDPAEANNLAAEKPELQTS